MYLSDVIFIWHCECEKYILNISTPNDACSHASNLLYLHPTYPVNSVPIKIAQITTLEAKNKIPFAPNHSGWHSYSCKTRPDFTRPLGWKESRTPNRFFIHFIYFPLFVFTTLDTIKIPTDFIYVFLLFFSTTKYFPENLNTWIF